MSASPSPHHGLPHRGLIVLLVGLTAFGPMSIDMYLPSLPTMAAVFSVESSRIQMTLSVFFLGLIIATPIYGPLSDRFGRRPVVLCGISLYLLGCVACLLAPSLPLLLGGRLLQALGSASGFVVSRAVVRDRWDRHQAAQVMGLMSMAMALAPFFAPILGGWLHSVWGWQANFWAMLVFGLSLWLATLLMLKESNRNLDLRALDPLILVRNYRMLARHRVTMGFSLVLGMTLGGMFAFVSGSSYTLINVLGIDPSWFGAGFGSVCLGFLAGGFMNSRLVSGVGLYRMVVLGATICAICGSIGAALAWAGIQTIAAVLLPLVGFYFGAALVMPNGTLAAILPFPRIAGSASALVGMTQMALGTTVTVLFAALFDGTTRPLVSLTGGCGVLALLLALWVTRKQKYS